MENEIPSKPKGRELRRQYNIKKKQKINPADGSDGKKISSESNKIANSFKILRQHLEKKRDADVEEILNSEELSPEEKKIKIDLINREFEEKISDEQGVEKYEDVSIPLELSEEDEKEKAQQEMNADLAAGLADAVILNKDMNDRIENEENSEPILNDLSHEEIGHSSIVDEGNSIEVLKDFKYEENGELSIEERVELKSIVAEKIIEIEAALERVENEFGYFLEGHLKEPKFNHLIQKEIIALVENLKKIKNIINIGDNITHTTSEEILKLIHETDDLIKISNPKEWEQELLKFKESLEKENIEFSQEQKEKISVATELFKKKKFIETLMDKADWSGYREADKEVAIELVIKAQLRLVMEKMKNIFNTEEISEKAIGEIFNNLKHKKINN